MKEAKVVPLKGSNSSNSSKSISHTTASSHDEGAANVKNQKCSIQLQYVLSRLGQDVRVANDSLFSWANTYWQMESLNESEHHASHWLAATDPETYSAHTVSGMVRSCLKELPRLGEQAPDVIPTLGGYLRLHQGADGKHTFTVNPYDRQCRMRYCINASLPSDVEWALARHGHFFRFLNTVVPDQDVQRLLQEYAGYTLLGDTRFQMALMLLGPGANGKGVFCRVLSALHQKVTSVNLAGLDRFGMQQLLDATLVLVDEMPRSGIQDQTLKTILSGDAIFIDRKNRDGVMFNCRAKFVMAANHVSHGLDMSQGFWRRMILVDFGVTIPAHERDGNLHQKIIDAELGIVLKWAIDGLLRLLDRGYFAQTESSERTKRAARISSSSVLQYIEDIGQLQHTPGVFTTKDDIYQPYVNWCLKNRKQPSSSESFWTQINRECNLLGIEMKVIQPRINGQRPRQVDIAITCLPDDIDEPDTRERLTFQQLMEKATLVEVLPENNPFGSTE